MEDKRQLIITKGEEFRLSIRNKIDKTDIFYDQYIDAAKMLNDIVVVQEDESETSDNRFDKQYKKYDQWCKTEYENNIIAFCGERGEGKSSAMMSFVNAVYQYRNYNKDEDSIFTDCENIKRTYFAEPIVIDPSMMDGVHNVLDIVLATLYQKFRNIYDEDNQHLDAYEREKLLNQFQTVYKSVSLINNQDKMLDDEYDYEGNISKLSRLGQSTGLKDELENLIKVYLEIMPNVQERKKGTGSLLIAIDDLDLCSSHAYKMAEQIRKYLIIPHVVIVMAIKVEQLEMCVRENNLRNYKNVIRIREQEAGIAKEVASMSERYVAKLIPKARRNYLPNVRTMHNVKIVYEGRNGNDILSANLGSSVNDIILNLIYEKTGMKFLKDKSGKNYFLPDNLRDTVNILVLLAGMDDPQGNNSIYYDNIQKFSRYYERQWLFSGLDLEECHEIQQLLHEETQLHESVAFLLDKCYRLTEKKIYAPSAQFLSEIDGSFFRVIGWFEAYRFNVFGKDEKKYAYVFHILYTIRLNELIRLGQYHELIIFMGGYVWAGNFANVLPRTQGTLDRSRFILRTVRAFNVIAEELYPNRDIFLPESLEEQYYITEISPKDENRKAKIVTWLLLGMLSNTYLTNPSHQIIYTFDAAKIVFFNHSLLKNLQISLENYIISLCDVERIYEKVNMEYLGIEWQEFQEIVKEIQESNKEMINAVRKIVTNIDIAMEFKEYCREERGIKEKGVKNEFTKSETAVEIFFKNFKQFVKEYFKITLETPDRLNIKYESGEANINISYLYTLLIQAGGDEEDNFLGKESRNKEELIKAFAAKLRERTDRELPLERVSTYLKTKTSRHVKNNMDRLASNIKRYYSVHREERLEEAEILELCDFYGKVLDVFCVNAANAISGDLAQEYKRIVKKYQHTCQ